MAWGYAYWLEFGISKAMTLSYAWVGTLVCPVFAGSRAASCICVLIRHTRITQKDPHIGDWVLRKLISSTSSTGCFLQTMRGCSLTRSDTMTAYDSLSQLITAHRHSSPFLTLPPLSHFPRDELMDGLWTGVRPVHLYNSSQMVSKYSGMLVQPNKAIVGANAFSHESGMHQDGMLKHRETYQIMSPETIGLQQKSGDPGRKHWS